MNASTQPPPRSTGPLRGPVRPAFDHRKPVPAAPFVSASHRAPSDGDETTMDVDADDNQLIFIDNNTADSSEDYYRFVRTLPWRFVTDIPLDLRIQQQTAYRSRPRSNSGPTFDRFSQLCIRRRVEKRIWNFHLRARSNISHPLISEETARPRVSAGRRVSRPYRQLVQTCRSSNSARS